ncbi:LemA family protein [Proteocatella sphenisci]|uniref:LemA family protein n=1 Tax=Proteocatella sphenisci TaxID=181070 RepID=UPI00048FFCA7|nr:LemA family protein [Proteocatella sphenisci]
MGGALMVVLGLVVILGIISISYYNTFVKLRNQSDEAFSTMDVYLKKRYDLIPNLVEVVKQYAIHEKETLEKVIGARNMAMGSQSMDDRIQNENMLSGTLKSLFAVSENYPNLKADTSFLNLQSQLSSLENEISQARKYYNGAVRALNTKIEMFPSNIVANMAGFKKYPFFEAVEAERENVKVQF